MGQTGYFIFRIGFHQLIAMRTGIVGDRDADGADTRVRLHALEGHCGDGKFRQIGIAIDADKRIIGEEALHLEQVCIE